MSEVQPSPGPWQHRPEKHDDWGLIRDANGVPIISCAMPALCPDEPQEWQEGGYPEPPQITANSCMVAAVHDLFDALMAVLPSALLYHMTEGDEERGRAIYEQASKALDKAAGISQPSQRR